MEINVDKSIVSKSIKHYGEGMQSVVCMEELSELSQAISKEIRGVGNRSNLVEEWVKFKQVRNLKRINREKKD